MHDRGTTVMFAGGAPTVRTRFAPSPTGMPHSLDEAKYSSRVYILAEWMTAFIILSVRRRG